MYKAKIEIGGYKKGEEVPAEKALIWNEMYKESPVQKVGKDDVKTIEPVKEDSKPNAMIEDYLARSENVVIKNLKDDLIEIKDLKEMKKSESKNKKRQRVMSTIDKKLKSFD